MRAVVVAIALVAASSSMETDLGRPSRTFARAAFAAAIAPLPDGGLLYGERLTGRVRRVDANGQVEPSPVATVEVSTAGQRGLLGLAVAMDGQIFAAWTDPRRRLVVGAVAPAPRRLVWRGPTTARRANGGHVAFAPDGRLVVGVGDLQQGARVDDPAAVNGKLLALAPDAGPDQTPAVISGGWNNPFAFAFAPDGALWVADNAPGTQPERLTRGDVSGPITDLPPETAPSGLAVDADGRLLVCGFVSGELLRYEVVDGRPQSRVVLADDCRLGVAVLQDGRTVYANENRLRLLDVNEREEPTSGSR
jgi:Glucose / Sorbosone dehydrogenase